MLPSWRNQLRVVLCPDKAIILGLGKGLRRKVEIQAILSCIPMPDAPAWQPALSAFEQWLGANDTGKAEVTVVLSNHFVRYALMPFSEDVTSRAEEQTLAQILFESIYGDWAKQWQFQIGEGGYGEARLVAGVDSMLLNRIGDVMAAHSLRLRGVAPYLVSAFNRFHERIQEDSGLFAVAEPGQLAVIAFRSGQISGVRRVPLNGGLEELLPNLLQREMLTSGLDMETVPVYLHIAGQVDINLPTVAGMYVHLLQQMDKNGTRVVEDARFDMASVGYVA